ncbi:regulatory protein, luxR family [Parafrankia irregularis]|uniref:Regulatory protein, luxR family n=1 Tax=Parafrankia irregularis TaxID=795642 RepID=A0A0S4QVG2_9ACTN|nr:regulatory protein, luxR family [Parafrankia irregularis]
MLVGREKELGDLRDRLSRIESRGCGVGLVGEAGVGKSALQAAVVADARARGFTVLTARGSEAETHLPFASLHQVLRPVLARSATLPARQRDALLSGFGMSEVTSPDPFLIALAVLELVVDAARQAPVLMSLDDLHWMDEPSVDVAAFVARRVESERVMVLASVRAGSASFTDDPSMEWMTVAGLDASAASALVDEHAPDLTPALRERVLRAAQGNPLALQEFPVAMRSGRFGWTELSDELPMTTRLERAFVSRVAHLPAATRTLLMVAALDDGTDLAEMLAAASIVAGATVGLEASQPAFDEGLLISDGAVTHFRHPLVRSALWHTTPLARRQAGHAALASVLSGPHPDRATWHRASSITSADERIAAELEQAARNAFRRGALVSAVSWLRRAAALSPDQSARGARLLDAAEIAFELGRFSQVEQIRRQVAGMALRPRDQSRLAWLEGVFDDGCSGESAEVRRLSRLAEQALHTSDPDLAMQLLVGAARRVWWSDPGADVRQEIVRMAQQVPLPEDDPRLLAVCALAESNERGSFVIGQLADWPSDAHGRPEAAGLLGIAAFCTGDFARAVEFLSTPVDALRAQGRLSLLAEALAIRAWAAIYLGGFELARTADEAMRLADETGQTLWAATARIAIAAIGAIRGSHGPDAELLTAAERVAVRTPIATSSLLAGVQFARGLAELGAARYEQAYGQLRRVFDPEDPAFQRAQQVWTLSYLAEAAVHTGRQDEGRALLVAIERVAGSDPSPAARIALEYSRAVLADDTTAEVLFQQALDGGGRRLPWHRARAELAYGSWLRRHRRLVESRTMLRAARDAFDTLGARAWAERADQELRATGEKGWLPTVGPGDLLSPQEAQIAELAAQGLSNREIAQRLYLSHRTIGSHLYRIFPKLGITSRAQLRAALASGTAPPGETARSNRTAPSASPSRRPTRSRARPDQMQSDDASQPDVPVSPPVKRPGPRPKPYLPESL